MRRRSLKWVRRTHPTEIVQSVNPAYVKALEARAKDLGLGFGDRLRRRGRAGRRNREG